MSRASSHERRSPGLAGTVVRPVTPRRRRRGFRGGIAATGWELTGLRGTVALVILDSLDVTAEQFAAGTGWEMKPEGACKAEVCVPLDQSEGFDLVATVARLGMSLVRDEQAGLWAVGPESLGGRALVSAEAPELVLDDVNGNEFRLSSLRGQKVVVVSWAPY